MKTKDFLHAIDVALRCVDDHNPTTEYDGSKRSEAFGNYFIGSLSFYDEALADKIKSRLDPAPAAVTA